MTSPKSTRTTSDPAMHSTDFRLVQQAFIDRVLNDHDLDALDELVAEDFYEQNPPPGMGPGRQGFSDYLGSMFAAFPDLRWDVKHSVAQDGCVAMWSVWSGTHRGEFMGIPATGRTVAVEAWTWTRYATACSWRAGSSWTPWGRSPSSERCQHRTHLQQAEPTPACPAHRWVAVGGEPGSWRWRPPPAPPPRSKPIQTRRRGVAACTRTVSPGPIADVQRRRRSCGPRPSRCAAPSQGWCTGLSRARSWLFPQPEPLEWVARTSARGFLRNTTFGSEQLRRRPRQEHLRGQPAGVAGHHGQRGKLRRLAGLSEPDGSRSVGTASRTERSRPARNCCGRPRVRRQIRRPAARPPGSTAPGSNGLGRREDYPAVRSISCWTWQPSFAVRWGREMRQSGPFGVRHAGLQIGISRADRQYQSY